MPSIENFRRSPVATWAKRAAVAALLTGCGESAGGTFQPSLPDAAVTDGASNRRALDARWCRFRLESVQNFGGNEHIRPEVIKAGTTATFLYLWPNSEDCAPWISEMLERGEVPDGGDRPVVSTPAEIKFNANSDSPTTIRSRFTIVGGERYKPTFSINGGDLVHLPIIPTGFTGIQQVEIILPLTPFSDSSTRANLDYDLTAPTVNNISVRAAANTIQTDFTTTEGGVWSLELRDSNGNNPLALPRESFCTVLQSEYLLPTSCDRGAFCNLTPIGGNCRSQLLGGRVEDGRSHSETFNIPTLPAGDLSGVLHFSDFGGNFVSTPVTITR